MTRIVCALLVLSLPVVSSSTQIHGVAPSDQLKYTSNEFSCVVGGKLTNLPINRVNDEYCDCDEGDDEPGTAACSHVIMSVFHCENDGVLAGKIHTSRIHDGICDCCDGSDEEIDGRRPCPNKCSVAADKFRKEAEQRLEVVKTGFEKRQATVNGEIATYFGREQEWIMTMGKEVVELKLLKERVTVHKDREELRELKYRLEVARQKQVNFHDSEKTSRQDFSETVEAVEFETLDAIQVADDDAPVTSAEDERALEVLDSNRQTVKSLIELPDSTRISLADYLRMNHNEQARTKKKTPRAAEERPQDDFLGPLLNWGAGGRKRIGLHALRVIGVVVSPVRALVEVLLYSRRTLWSALSIPEFAGPVIDRLPDFPSPSRSVWFRRLGGGIVYNSYRLVAWGAQVVWDAPVYVYHYLFPTLDNEMKLPLAESLRTVLCEIESNIAKLEKDRNEKRETAEMDYGPDRAYFALKKNCIEKRVEKYEYKFCAFGEIKQDQTKLGKWDGWYGGEDKGSPLSGKVDYARMRYSQGEKCYNGPERSVLLHLECGERDEILSVDEPSTCVYEMTVRSPLACTAEVYAKAREDVAFWTRKQLQ
ncbi:unnamed protein product [Peronospora destructor]|uniref:Glucosidase 2 subunit beta n=1 Tax=Peronospora destructor TaxID=86335 RepID=A0AAV0TGQ0_9STRA|nr:unnamed protein product [Peronospora destructor]